MRDLEQLIADGQNADPSAPGVAASLQSKIVEYDFSNERDEYRIGNNDVLNVFVVGHPEISSQRVNMGEISGNKVQKNGKVYLPVVGPVAAAGYTLVEFQEILKQTVAKFVVEPEVSVEILQYGSQKFFVLGQVQRPGVFAVDGDTSLLEGMSLAGGITSAGNLEAAHVLRGGQLLPINLADLIMRGNVERNIFMRHGDVVYVPDVSDQKVIVVGEVATPKAVPIARNRMTLAEALAEAGGPGMATSRKEVAILRGGYARPIVYTINLEQALLYDDQILLRPGDRVVVAPTGLATSSRYMTQFLPFLQGLQAVGVAAQGATNMAIQAGALSQ